MGTCWSLHAVSPPPGVRRGIEAVLDRVVAQMSQWEAGSDLSRFNRAAPNIWREVPPELANGFGFDGELLEKLDGVREVTTEHMIGTDYPSTLNELTLTKVEEGTLLTLVITYANAEARDAVLATGMTDGMEASYRRLDELVATA